MLRRVSIPTHRRTGPIVALALTATVAAALATHDRAQAATAAVLKVDKPCYVITHTVPSITITGSGFAPGSNVLITSTANVDASTKADAGGDISVKVSAPAPHFTRPAVKQYLFTAKDEGTTPAISATRIVRVAPFGAQHGATPKAPGLQALTERTNWSFSGFTSGEPVYAHYTIAGKQVALETFGTAHGDCGTLHARAPLYPAAPHHASYPVQFDSVQSYSPNTTPKITGHVALNTSF